jgi:hypothetical protein
LLEAGLGSPTEEGMVVRKNGVLVGRDDTVLVHLALEHGAGLDGECIGGEMGDGERGELGEVVLPAVEGLVGKAVYEVDAEVVEAGIGSRKDGLTGLGGAVATVEQTEVVVGEGLEADAEAVEKMEIAKPAEVFGGEVLGVGFEGGFLKLGEVEAAGNGVDNLAELSEGEDGGGAAAEIDGAQGVRLFGTAQLGLTAEGVDVVLPAAGGDGGEESAVGACAMAEGDVEVEQGEGGGYWREELRSWSAAW